MQVLPTNWDVPAVEPLFIPASHVLQDGVRYVVGESVPWSKSWWYSIVPFPLCLLPWGIMSKEFLSRVSETVPSDPLLFLLFLLSSFRTSSVLCGFGGSGLRNAAGFRRRACFFRPCVGRAFWDLLCNAGCRRLAFVGCAVLGEIEDGSRRVFGGSDPRSGAGC